MDGIKEHDTVRITGLATAANVSAIERPPQIGDQGYVIDLRQDGVTVECIDSDGAVFADGRTLWIADFDESDVQKI